MLGVNFFTPVIYTYTDVNGGSWAISNTVLVCSIVLRRVVTPFVTVRGNVGGCKYLRSLLPPGNRLPPRGPRSVIYDADAHVF